MAMTLITELLYSRGCLITEGIGRKPKSLLDVSAGAHARISSPPNVLTCYIHSLVDGTAGAKEAKLEIKKNTNRIPATI